MSRSARVVLDHNVLIVAGTSLTQSGAPTWFDGAVNGPHDLGGADGFGPVVRDGGAREGWELRVHALAGAGMMAGPYGTPVFRHALERIPPARYLSSSYYERWTIAIASLLAERGILSTDELSRAAGENFPLSSPVRAPRCDPSSDVTDPRFAVGDHVRVRNVHPLGHTRCPRYVRGRLGTIVRYDGPCNFDDVEAHSDGRRLEPLYSVRFESSELWGEAAEARSAVHVDLFDQYLEEP